MKRIYYSVPVHWWCLLLVLVTIPTVFAAAPAKPQLDERYGKLPLSFEENQGQSDSQVRFLSKGPGYSLFLTDDQAVFSFGKDRAKNVVRMQLEKARHHLHVSPEDRLPGTANYFIGSDSTKWHSAIPTYRKVRYSSVYDGVDLFYYGNGRQLEYDFVVAPNANAKQIRLRFDGAQRVLLEGNGDLRIFEHAGEIAFHKPVIYQELNGQRAMVEGRFMLIRKNVLGFALGEYDRTRALVIDPTLAYSTLLGGNTANGASASAVAADTAGNAYVVGTVSSNDFPVTPGAFQTVDKSNASSSTMFVTKIDPTGSKLIYSAYLGGSGNSVVNGLDNVGDSPYGITVDSAGNAYIVGGTSSFDFPVTNGAFQTVNKAAALGSENGFVTKLNSSGTQIIYSTYLGGAVDDTCSGVVVDSVGTAYVTGGTTSLDFPITNGAFQSQTMEQAAMAVTPLSPSSMQRDRRWFSPLILEAVLTMLVLPLQLTWQATYM